MIKFQVALFFILVKIVTINNVPISSDFKNVFQPINDKILATVDDVFILLKINENFTKSKTMAENLLLNNFIQNVSENNNKKYEKIYNLSKITIDDNKTAYFIFIINEMIEEFLMRDREKLKSSISVEYYKNNLVTKNKNDSQVISERKNIINLNYLKSEFESKLEKWIIMDIVYKLLFANYKKSFESQEEYDLKFWDFNMTKNLQTRRIFNAQKTSIEEVPFLVSVHIQGQFCCAGSIIRKDFVITAASCLRPFHVAQRIPHLALEVRVGSDFTNKDGMLIPVTEMYFHPQFNQESLINNLVILKLNGRLKFNDKIRKISIDTNAYKLPENAENILILGWGSVNTKEDKQFDSKPLSYAFVDVYNLQECKSIYSSFYVKDKNFCTGYVSKGSGACKNDIGGPAVVGSTLTGVISYGSPHCGQPDAPTVYTKLGYYAAWINSVVGGFHQDDFQLKSRDIKRPNNIMSESEFFEDANNITAELETLAELIGELQVAEHLNSSLTEIIHENGSVKTNVNSTTNKDERTPEERDYIDVINANIVNILQSMANDSISKPVGKTVAPEFIQTSSYEDEDAQNDKGVIFYSKESEESTTRKSKFIDLDTGFAADNLYSKPYLQTPELTTNANLDESTQFAEWPSTRFGKEILSEMKISNEYSEYGDINDSTDNDIIHPIIKSEETDNSKLQNIAEQDQMDIVFLTSSPRKRLSTKTTKEPKLLRKHKYSEDTAESS